MSEEGGRYYSDGEICRAYLSAANPKEQIKVLAELNNMTTREIKKILSDNHIVLPKKKSSPRTYRNSITEAEEKICREILERGGNCREIAKAIGRKEGTIYAFVRRNGLEWKVSGRANGDGWTQGEVETLMVMRKTGKSFKEISAIIGRGAHACCNKYQRILDSGGTERRTK